MNQSVDHNSPESIEDQHQARKEKLKSTWKGRQAYPNDFRREMFVEQIHAMHGGSGADQLREAGEKTRVAGRVMASRKMGKVTFADLRDSTGKIQLFVRSNTIGTTEYERFAAVDIGDIVGAKGKIFRTRTGELSIEVHEFELLSKSLWPYPEKFHGLKHRETRYRQRYLDLIMNEEVRKVFLLRAALIHHIRTFMNNRQYLEVETPMMHTVPGGAIARPFVTHHNALSLDMFLRIAPELYLKRLVVGGLERVYEINRNFRNEGVSTQHNPEFTMMEFYEAYADYLDFMKLTEELFLSICDELLKSSIVNFLGHTIDLKPPFRKITLEDSVRQFNPDLSEADLRDLEQLKPYLLKLGGEVNPIWGAGKLLFEIFERTVEHRLIEPTFITQYPVEVSPLSRINDNDQWITDRFEFFVGGIEIANGFSELNDPEDQANRFRSQLQQREHGDDEAMVFDDDYIRALEYGLPPTAGEGIGIDRLIMLLTDSSSIRDVVLFPHMKPHN